MPFSRTEANALIEHFIGKTDHTFVLNRIYVGITFGAASTATTPGTEPTTGGYIRQPVIGSAWDSATNSVTQNDGEITFPIATADWGGGADMTGIVLFDADTAGNYLGFKALTVNKPVLDGDTAKILDAQLQVGFSEV